MRSHNRPNPSASPLRAGWRKFSDVHSLTIPEEMKVLASDILPAKCRSFSSHQCQGGNYRVN
jgi:hypothetical protein